MPVGIIQIQNRLSPALLTIRAQTVSPIDNGELHWDNFFPKEDALSSRFSDIATVDFRPAASRRPWDALGKQIPVRVGKIREGRMTPIESWFAIGEEEIQRLGEDTGGNAAVVLDAIAARVPARVDKIAMADWRALERDFVNAWVNGFIRVTDPDKPSDFYDVSFQIDAARMPAAPATYGSAANAYDQFISSFYRPALDACGGLEGAVLTRAVLDEIVRDAPVTAGIPGYRPTIKDVEMRIGDEYGYAFHFEIAEWSMDIADDAGNFTRQRYWPSDAIAAIPMGRRVGSTKMVKQYKAWDVATAEALTKAGYDQMGVLITQSPQNDYKSLKTLASLLAMPIPDEFRVFVQRGAAA